MKEAINTIQQVVYTGYMNGSFSGINSWGLNNPTDPIVSYMTSNLNAQNCVAGNNAAPCNHGYNGTGPSYGFNSHSGRWVFSSGVHLTLYSVQTNPNSIAFFIDVEPNKSFIIGSANANEIHMYCNISETVVSPESQVTVKPGQCMPADNGHKITYDALYSN